MTKLNNYKSLLILGLLLVLGACNKDNRTRYEQRLTTSFELPLGLNLLETHVFVIENIDSRFDDLLKEHNLTIDQITDVEAGPNLMDAPLNSSKLNFLEEVVVRVYNKSDPNAYKEMYYLDPVPFNVGSSIFLNGSLSNLTPVLSKDRFDMEIRVKLRSFAPSNLRFDFDFGYFAYIE